MIDLKHYGTVGMRWGVRKLRSEGAERVLKKGQTVHHVSEKPEILLKDGSFYTSFTKKDVLHYKAGFADDLLFHRNVWKVYDHSFKTTTDLISPTKKRAIDEMIELAKKDPEFLSSLSNSKSKSNLVLGMAKMFGADKKRAEEYRRMLFSKNPKDQEQLFKEHMAYMLLDNKTQKKYFDHLMSKGFNSVYDFNDILTKQAEKPLIIFDAKSKIVSTGEKEKLGFSEITKNINAVINAEEKQK